MKSEDMIKLKHLLAWYECRIAELQHCITPTQIEILDEIEDTDGFHEGNLRQDVIQQVMRIDHTIDYKK